MPTEKPPYYRETRRLIVELGLLAFLRTALVTGLNVELAKPRKRQVWETTEAQTRKAEEETSSGKPLEVWHFAGEIVQAAARETRSSPLANLVSIAFGWFTGDALGGYALRESSQTTQRAAGGAGMFAGRGVDLLSTFLPADVFRDPQFTEYGLKPYFTELNSALSPHPDPAEVAGKSSLLLLPSTVLATIFPSLGRGYAGASPFIFKNNLEVARLALKGIEIGDRVKELIFLGRKESDIRSFLEGYGQEDNDEGLET